MLSMQGFESLSRHVRVNLGSTQITVPQKQLHDPQIGPMINKVGGEGVPQGMRRQRAIDERSVELGAQAAAIANGAA